MPIILLALLYTYFTCWCHFRSDVILILMPRSCSILVDVSNTLRLFFEHMVYSLKGMLSPICIVLHFSVLSAINQVLHHSTMLFISLCRDKYSWSDSKHMWICIEKILRSLGSPRTAAYSNINSQSIIFEDLNTICVVLLTPS
jgi:hypothetical protein